MKNYNHHVNIVKKPWGYEYLMYENNDIALWFLFIDHSQSTSLHCHPSKTTGLICIDGDVEVSFFNDINVLKPCEKIMIRKGLFHSTKSISINGSIILEIETPVDKKDLVRFRDNYGREGKPYENIAYELPKNESCITIKEPPLNSNEILKINDTELEVMSVTRIDQFLEIEDSLNVIFLNGGIKTDYEQYVAGPGDVVLSKTLKNLLGVFKNIDQKTVIILVKKNG